jgi:hypothetical protein
MFHIFKSSIDVDFWAFQTTLPKIGQNFIQFSGHTGHDLKMMKKCVLVSRLFDLYDLIMGNVTLWKKLAYFH